MDKKRKIEIKTLITNSKKIKKALEKNLERFNYRTAETELLNPKIYTKKEVEEGIYLFKNGSLIGGAQYYFSVYNWIVLNLLWVDELFRNQKLGSYLVNQLKEILISKKCIGIKTETWDFQAKGFYEKNGFQVFGELEDEPLGHKVYYLCYYNGN